MGYEYADAQNTAVRVLLYQVSKKYKFFNDYYREKTLKYFNYKCPYTGLELIPENRPEMDHIIPANKNSCGLHVYGNILIVARNANSQKGNQSIEEFLKNQPKKLYKIQTFMKESGYLDIHQQYCSKLKEITRLLYDEIGKSIQDKLSYIDVPNYQVTSKTILKNKVIKKINEKDNSKYTIIFKTENDIIYNLSKRKVVLKTFEYLINKNILNQYHIKIFSKNTFARSFATSTGDLLINNPNNPTRYTEFIENNTKYYICNQWDINSISKFNEYINKTFGEYLTIEKQKTITAFDIDSK